MMSLQGVAASKQECVAGPDISCDIRSAVSRNPVVFRFYPLEPACCGRSRLFSCLVVAVTLKNPGPAMLVYPVSGGWPGFVQWH